MIQRQYLLLAWVTAILNFYLKKGIKLISGMYQSKNIREPSTFGKNPHDDSTRPDIHKDSINAVTMSTLNQTAGYGLRCPNGVRDGVYQCEICERLRRVCPISGTQTSQTYVRSH